MAKRNSISGRAAWQLRLGGRVQGVGFRPFVYRLARRFALTGWVQNRGSEVVLHVEGDIPALEAFRNALLEESPPLSRPLLLAQQAVAELRTNAFTISPSSAESGTTPHIPPDQFVCDDCLNELNDPHDRRHRYPFINCTQCGPRYTLIEALPYDRQRTSMAGFPLCPACQAEYDNPLDRRFHAEPLACPVCGPQLHFRTRSQRIEGNEASLAATTAALRRGEIVAIKGIGGYHLMCDARNEQAVARLRARKQRPHKPLAVMFPQRGEDGLMAVREALVPTAEEAARLCSPQRPIVLCRKRTTTELAVAVAPDLAEIGAMLPYSPLHHLLLSDFGAPLIATSGNISGEPVLTDNNAAEQRLAHIADAFLHHDRPILRPADDPLYRRNSSSLQPLRLGRGDAPLELDLPFHLEVPLLAVGGQMKNSIALAWGQRCVLSPHIGDLDSPRTRQVFEQVIADLQRLYGVKAEAVIADTHPGYASHRWARDSGLPLITVQHHHAHASALYGEHGQVTNASVPWLVLTWDGVGYGADGTLWGGEALLGSPGHWRRFARLRPFRLPGAEAAARQPWRSALGLCWEAGTTWPDAPADTAMLRQAWQRGLNTPQTSAAGRLFDAAAALLGLADEVSYEGQAPMALEAIAAGKGDPLRLPLIQQEDGLWQGDWSPLIGRLCDSSKSRAQRAMDFHASLALFISNLAEQARQQYDLRHIGLCGGVFQNRLLSEQCLSLLQPLGFQVFTPHLVPGNDAGLAWGQIIEAAAVQSPPQKV